MNEGVADFFAEGNCEELLLKDVRVAKVLEEIAGLRLKELAGRM